MKYFLSMDNLIVNVNGKTITINKTDKRYDRVLDAINEDRHDEVMSLADNETTEEIRNLLKIRIKKGNK